MSASALKVVHLEASADPIKKSPGFKKKLLADRHLEMMALCGFGCRYCSSNNGNFLRIRRGPFADETQRQLGSRYLPATTPELHFDYPNIVARLEAQLAGKPKSWGAGEVLVMSQLTDAFSGTPLANGDTRRALELVLSKTSFRVRILTKWAGVGRSVQWRDFFAAHRDRVLVGLSCGTLNNEWARAVEVNTPPPTARLAAYRDLQAAGVPTFGMMCPVMPDQTGVEDLRRLLAWINPAAAEEVFVEPFNDRDNWRAVAAGYPEGSAGRAWMEESFGKGDRLLWSAYATNLLLRVRREAIAAGWLSKLRS